jgi:hypothetical protein
MRLSSKKLPTEKGLSHA